MKCILFSFLNILSNFWHVYMQWGQNNIHYTYICNKATSVPNAYIYIHKLQNYSKTVKTYIVINKTPSVPIRL